MADKDTDASKAKALKRAVWAHNKYVAAAEKAEGLRALRNVSILDAVEEAGATQREVAAELDGMTQQAVGSIVKRTKVADPDDSN